MKKIIYLVAAFLCLSCSDDHESNPQNGGASGSVTEVTPVTSDLCVELTTDKAFYKPNETVTFTAADALPAGTKVRYRLSGEIVGEEPVSGTNWTWKAPSNDFKGYMAELYRQENGTDVIVGTIAVDVSSHQARFPRYGFVADFEGEKTEENVLRVRKEFIPYYDIHNADDSRPYPGISALLSYLQSAGIQNAVASNKYQAATEKLVAHYFPEIHFTAVFGKREGVNVKPDPTIVFDILKLADARKEDVLYVGDSGVDMQTAANAGVTACGVTWGFRPRTELEEFNPAYMTDVAEKIKKMVF